MKLQKKHISLVLNFKIKISHDALKGIYLEMDNVLNINNIEVLR